MFTRYSLWNCHLEFSLFVLKILVLSNVFSYGDRNVRTVMINNEPWFVAKDVCDILEISKYRDAVSRLDNDERGSVLMDTLGGNQQLSAINESGLYSLIMASRKPEAKSFRKWITHEVIPSNSANICDFLYSIILQR
ncbi:Bro-N domain-containing protein [Paenibacillus sp. FSL H8-0175]